MRKLIYTIIIIVLGAYAWCKFDLGQYFNRVKIAITDLRDKEETAQKAVEEHIDARKDLYQIMVLMNEVTINTMKLERIGEGKGLASSQLPMKQQIEEKMKLLKEQLDEAREYAKENAELTAEVDRLQRSFQQREQTIRRLTIEGEDLDEKNKEAIIELERETEKLREENNKLDLKNIELRSIVDSRKKIEINAWELAGDELVNAARNIPRGNQGKLNQGKQSEENKPSRQNTLKNAYDSYNNGIKLANRYGQRDDAIRLHNKALKADRLLSLVNQDMDI